MQWQWTPESHANPPNAYAMSKILTGDAGY